MSDPHISVVMPVYNAEPFIAKAMESVLSQTYPYFECIVINDGSTDKTGAILQSFSERDTRIRLVSRENRGLVATLNEGIALARAPLIARMDADDIAYPERFSLQITFMNEHPEVVALGTCYEVIDFKDRVLVVSDLEPQSNEEIQNTLLSGIPCLCHPTVMMRKEAVLRVGGYEPETMLAEDLDLWLRLGEIGQLANLPQVLLGYREHGGSVSEVGHFKQIEVMKMVTERAWKRRDVIGQFQNKPWRPTSIEAQQHRTLKYGWRAYVRGDRRMAMDYGWMAIREFPMKFEGWFLLFCAVFKPMKKPVQF
jgi:glycosyltransferase involved in cell wall biosynthesis